MVYCTGMPVHSPEAVELVVNRPSQLRAIGHHVRTRILLELELHHQSAKELATSLGMTHGRIDHHLGILEREGFVRVLEERRVRGVTERRFGPTFSRMRIDVPGSRQDRLRFAFAQAAREAAPDREQPFTDTVRIYSVRMPEERAAEFSRRLIALADEFAAADGAHGIPVGLVAAVYATVAHTGGAEASRR
jgi:DNA-binding transcriptional ArsR family regulator